MVGSWAVDAEGVDDLIAEDDEEETEEEGRCVGMVSPAREPCSRSSAKMRCLERMTWCVRRHILGLRERKKEKEGKNNVLPRQPAPKLERLLSNAPSSREVSEFAHVRRVVRESE